MIDDDAGILESLTEIMKPAMYNCSTTTSPNEGLALMKKFNYDLVITDIRMEEMDGKEMIKKIRKMNEGIKIIVISAYCDSQLVHFLLDFHIWSYFKKPLNIKEFMGVLADIEKKVVHDNKRHLDLYKNKNNDFFRRFK